MVKDIDEALQYMGGFGKYQRTALTIVTLCFGMGSYSLYPMGYYELLPDYECSHFDQELDAWTDWQPCSNTDFCEDLRVEGQEYTDSRFE